MRKNLAVLAALLFSIAVLSVAQDVPRVIADVPFSFTVGKETLPAGQYIFTEGNLAKEVLIQGQSTKVDAIALVVTRLGPRPDNQAEVVFDQVGSNHYLSEIHVPGVDGYLFQGAPGKHTHVRIKASKK